MKKVLSVILCFMLAMGLCACSVSTTSSTAPKASDPSASETAAESTAASQTEAPTLAYIQDGDLDAVVAKSEHFDFTRGEMIYMFATLYASNSSYLSYIYGIDLTKSLKEQPLEDGSTAYDLIVNMVVEYVSSYLYFAEAANDKGLTLTADDEAELAGQKADAEASAAGAGLELDEYFSQYFGTNISYKYVDKLMRLMKISEKGYNAICDELVYTDDQIKEYYENNRKKIDLVDLVAIPLDAEKLSEEQIADLEEKFKAAADETAFAAAAQEYVKLTTEEAELASAGSDEEYTKSFIEKNTILGTGCIEGDEAMEWAFGDEAEEGEVFVESTHTVYRLLKKPYKPMDKTVDIRHILFALDEYGTAEDARAKADEIYAEWKKNGAKEDEFITLCAEYSADGNAQTGGIYEGVTPGQMVETFNDWCFDESRGPGDHGIVDTNYGSHMMYFIASQEAWYKNSRQALFDADYTGAARKVMEAHTIDVNEELLDSVNW